MNFNKSKRKTRLANVMQFSAGPNFSRLKNKVPEESAYSAFSIEEDLCQISEDVYRKTDAFSSDNQTKIGDLVVGMRKGKAAVVGSKNAGKFINSNFLACQYDPGILDPWFFCYWLNESEEAARQYTVAGGNRQVCTPAILELLEITLPDIETQRKIGNSYRLAKRCEYLMDQKKDEMNRLVLQLIKNQMKGN
jgi:restriction endonuclease S subunit